MQDNQLEAVILGCTELPLVYGGNSNPKIIDTLKVLSDGLLLSYFNR
jgi:aspartate/glutamate racemase